ncbi:sensor histidine kinase [Oceanospirillum maris]|uniref:sensor histidine kinase n=1 Tax=Oceanospirillum maris TaxID=64977 RepID=UPI0003FF67C0|nr:ATP-binding protein [Oceanospirillum maris]
MQRIKAFYRQNPLGLRLLTSILIYSSLITLFATGVQLWSDYRYERSAIDERLRQIENSSIRSLSNSLWEINPAQVQVQLEGLLQLPDVRYLEISSPYGELFFAGKKPKSSQLLKRYYTLEHDDYSGKTIIVGKLTLIVSLDEVYRRLANKILLILASQGVKTFLVSVFILIIFHQFITRHLSAMARYARRLKLDKLDKPLILNRQYEKDDELNDVVIAINAMRRSMMKDMQKRQQAEQDLADANQQLEALNTELEQRVIERTTQLNERSAELESRNKELQDTLIALQSTQKQLVESEKMAALGELVAGVAHEINTPIGIGFTAATYLSDQVRKIQPQGLSSEEARLLNLTLEGSELICKNLERAAQLIRAFKQVSVDQSSEQSRRFDLISYLNEILLSLQPRLKTSRPSIDIQGPSQLIIDSYPGSYYQIFSNLIINSIIHGFEHQTGGEIIIKISLLQTTANTTTTVQEQEKASHIQIDYFDNGKGITEDWHSKLFQPFVTSKRHLDCSGLGMHITYNIVSQLLQGQIQSLAIQKESNLSGAHFRITLPVSLLPI